jgi:hypothetical protein
MAYNDLSNLEPLLYSILTEVDKIPDANSMAIMYRMQLKNRVQNTLREIETYKNYVITDNYVGQNEVINMTRELKKLFSKVFIVLYDLFNQGKYYERSANDKKYDKILQNEHVEFLNYIRTIENISHERTDADDIHFHPICYKIEKILCNIVNKLKKQKFYIIKKRLVENNYKLNI